MQPQADAQKRLARVDGLQHGLDQIEAAQFGRGILEGPHARQNHFRRGSHLGGIAGDDGLMADFLEGLLHAAQIAHAVVDDGDHGRWGRGAIEGLQRGRTIHLNPPVRQQQGAAVQDEVADAEA